MNHFVLGVRVDATGYFEATDRIREWALSGESRGVNATGVHGVMEAYDSPEFRRTLNRADMITPDGMPLVWMLRLKGVRNQQRVYGPTLMKHVLEMAARENISVGFYGSEQSTLDTLVVRIQTAHPALNIAYAFSPPFRSLSEQETDQIRKAITKSGVRILFVGLGCPRQEKWIDAQHGHIPAVMLGVGAAFDFHAGIKPQAPGWVQNAGFEWLFRLINEPRRLWRRYLCNNPRFVFLAIADLLGYLHSAVK
jgi:N-acetylglucosaminyldiphosphoundecaprenol N-acetyl-beta-D-mannosaminyltransferase